MITVALHGVVVVRSTVGRIWGTCYFVLMYAGQAGRNRDGLVGLGASGKSAALQTGEEDVIMLSCRDGNGCFLSHHT